MNNAEKFEQIFGLYATELWSMPESDFLEWLNRDVETTQIDHTADIGKKVDGDCISRQAAIDILDAYQVMVENGEENPYTWARLQMSELQSAQPEQRLIPVTERLPEKNCRCLTTNEAWGSFEVDWNAWIDGQWLYPNEKPIAWRPFPEPYRGGEKE